MKISEKNSIMERIEDIMGKVERAERWFDSLPGSGHKTGAPVNISARDARMLIDLALDGLIHKEIESE